MLTIPCTTSIASSGTLLRHFYRRYFVRIFAVYEDHHKERYSKGLETISAPGEGQNLVESKAVTNIQIFGDEVEVDVTIYNPSLQAKKKTEVAILQAIHKEVYEKAKIKVNLKVEAPQAAASADAKTANLIKGKPIEGIQNIIAVASGKGGVVSLRLRQI